LSAGVDDRINCNVYKHSLFAVIFVSFLIFNSCARKQTEESVRITIFAASSLRQVVEEICAEYKKDNDLDFSLNFAASGTLARQIEYGADADIFLSANPQWVSYLDTLKLVKGNVVNMIENRLVIVGKLQFPADTLELAYGDGALLEKVQRIAIGDPDHVPAGRYALESLKSLGIYEIVEHQLIESKDVRGALRLVELGEADIGFVYLTDALVSEKVKILSVIPGEMHNPIFYVAAIVDKDDHANTFLRYLSSSPMEAIWKKHGFRRISD
jgi:molybdate transport system substrate-binding protein